jgi:hypothetical protein
MNETPWFLYHENIVTLTRYMAEKGCSADEVAYAVEKPWKYEEEFYEAEGEDEVEEEE